MQTVFQVQHGSAAPAAVRSPFTVEHPERVLRKSRHHADKGAHPQPEHRARTAERQRGCHTGDVARADRCGKCGAHGRKRRNAAACPSCGTGKAGKQRFPQPERAVPHLKNSGHRREVQSGAKQQNQHGRAPYQAAQPLIYL